MIILDNEQYSKLYYKMTLVIKQYFFEKKQAKFWLVMQKKVLLHSFKK